MSTITQQPAFPITGVVPREFDAPRVIAAGATGAAVLAGMFYALSPLTLVLGLVIVALIWWACRGLSGRERRWTLGLLSAAALVRVVAIGAIALTADPRAGSFRSVFGDGQYALERSLWLRNTLLNIPMSELQLAEAFNDYGRSIYFYPLAWLQVIFGPAPYALHLTSVVWCFAAAIAVYRLARSSYGRVTAFSGLVVILCLPSLVLWSIAPLKESLYFLMTTLAVVSTARMVRARRWTTAAGAIGIAAAATTVAAMLRTGGLAITLGGLGGGLLIAAVCTHRRAVVAVVVCVPIVGAFAIRQHTVQDAFLTQIRRGAVNHVGFVMTPGSNYKLLGFEFYNRHRDPNSLTRAEAIRYAAAAARDFVLIPKPWAPSSRNDVAMAPQQLIWYALVVFSVPGLVAGLRRDALVTGLLAATALVGAAAIAPSSGNVGTLIRHRDMIVPFLGWIGVLGVTATVRGCAALVRKEGE